jgi:hypothetical protein
MYNGKNLTDLPFKPNHANLLGTKLMSILFSTAELQNGTLNEDDEKFTLLDSAKINLIKG